MLAQCEMLQIHYSNTIFLMLMRHMCLLLKPHYRVAVRHQKYRQQS